MNTGYTNKTMIENGLNDLCCPICGSDIYVNKYGSDFACISSECKLYHGALGFMKELESVLSRL